MNASARPAAATSSPLAVRLVGASAVRPFSVANEERFRRCFARAGVGDVAPMSAGMPAGAAVCLVRGDWLFDDALIPMLAQNEGFVLVAEHAGRQWAVAARPTTDVVGAAASLLAGEAAFDAAHWAALGLAVRDIADLSQLAYRGNLRNRIPPYVLPLADMPIGDIEWRMFMASYKGVTDIVTRHVWPLPALALTRWCAAAGISPNAVTLVSFLCVVAATILFATGWFWSGLAAAWMMCFLDTVDGKLARVTVTSSKWGNVFDHGTDLVHPPFWWFAWYWGLRTLDFPIAAGAEIATAIVLAGYILGRAQEGIFLWAFGIEMHVWRPIDSLFRGVTARRNPNLLLFMAGTACGRPDWGLLLVAGWTVASFVFHCVRIGQAFIARQRGVPVVSWLTAEAAAVARPQTAHAHHR